MSTVPESKVVFGFRLPPEFERNDALWELDKTFDPALQAGVFDWGNGNTESWGFVLGVLLAKCDWDRPVEFQDLVGQPDREKRIEELCERLGITPEPCKLILFGSIC